MIWDWGPSHSAPQDWPLHHAVLAHGPGSQQLWIARRPRHARQFLVAPLKPAEAKPHHFRHAIEPHGISVPDDPIRAAAQVTRRVLPLYTRALTAVRYAARIEPDPPHRAAAREVSETLTLVWYPDGVVGAPYASVPATARAVLFAARFQYDPHQAAFVLPLDYSPEARAMMLQQVVRRLTADGIGVDFRQATTCARRPAPAAPGRPASARQPSSAVRR
ncbi:hypothetical protein [Streptomyces sp. F-1]|uniref:hypothetical protein n=1 Tax=Streptomyces sp. F-1 TaxID=463642 RepID=UPI00086CEA95|nr:hypothetical protein [Streptomyces sp. F-1]SFY48664.1 hypothetical protein STEPF1_01890 [Streptomyces sp. F-1]